VTDPRLALFLDRSTQGRRFVEALRALVDDVETIADRYGREAAQDVPDTQWIAEATAAGRILVGADRRILLNPLERRAVCRHRARYVVFGTNNLRVADMVTLFTAGLPAIRAHAREPGPWVLRIARHGTERLPMRCDDA
jgi:hypothetical protein